MTQAIDSLGFDGHPEIPWELLDQETEMPVIGHLLFGHVPERLAPQQGAMVDVGQEVPVELRVWNTSVVFIDPSDIEPGLSELLLEAFFPLVPGPAPADPGIERVKPRVDWGSELDERRQQLDHTFVGRG
jgi:hypothetical protein